MNNPTLTVYCGPMFSGKTTRLLSDLERFKLQRKRCAAFKPLQDSRCGINDIVSHSGWRHAATTVEAGACLIDALTRLEDMPDVVAVDEAFMIPGIAGVVAWLYSSGITVVVSTLDLSYACKPFREVEQLMPLATRVEKCAAVCAVCGRDAFYTHKKQVSGEEIEVGGSELYEPRCFSHHVAMNRRPDVP